MILETQEHPALPRLAWLARVSRNGRVQVRHGPWVEVSGSSFIEGAWDGDFAAGDFAESPFLMGSGAILREDGVLFCGAAHPIERLYLLEHGGDLLVSPSLVFVLEAGGAELDPNHIPYLADFIGFQRGLRRHVGKLPLAGGRHLDVLHFRNVHVGPELQVRVLRKPDSPSFRDFTHYRDYLVEGMRRFHANANAPERVQRYTPLVAVSSGYDSSACAALAADFGCEEAVTLRSARPSDPAAAVGEDDSGAEVARALGLRVTEYDREAYLGLDGLPEAEFVACGDLGQDVVMTALEDVLPGRYLISGEHGDTMWSRHWNLAKDRRGARDVVRPSCAGCSLAEFRLRVGFLHVPLPCVAATSLPDLMRISGSPEMAPWTLNTRYDRPIARRLAEEKGVPREAFGQSKKAVTVLLNRDGLLESRMSPRSYASFRTYRERRLHERSATRQAHYDRLFRIHRLFERSFGRLNRVLSRLGIPWQVPSPVPARFRRPPGEPSWLFHWGVAEIRDRYGASASQ